ncbi:MAG: ComEC/Rec2 family competence protein [Treponema sp.]|nr:ComEC/Rec2 family competence protein [Treponema sp.]
MEQIITRWINSNITPLLCAAAAAAAGFYILFYAPLVIIIIVISILIILFCLFRVLSSLDTNSKSLHVIYVCSTGLAAGVVIGLFAANAGRNEINFGIPQNNITAIEGVLLEDPRIISGGKAMALISLQRCAGEHGLRASSKGEIYVFFPQLNAGKLMQFGRGTVIFAEGILRSGDNLTFSADSLHVIKPASSIERMRTGIRSNLINRFKDETWGGLALALLLGVRDNLDSDFTVSYRNAGLSYILALSGMHLAILTALIAFLLKKPLGIKASLIIGAVIIILYCFLVGPMPSLNRAALMYILGVIAILFALPKKAISILSLSFLIQIIFTPAAGNSLSFILSYLALLGILLIGKALFSVLKGKIPDFILQPLAISFGAFVATSAVCSYTFGKIAPIGIIAGLAIVPLTAVFMIGSMIWLLLDVFSVSFILSYPLHLLYHLMEMIASISGNVPGIYTNPLLVLVLSIVISFVIIVLDYKRRISQLKLQPFL